METLQALEISRQDDFSYKVIESEEHRLEIWEFSYPFPTLDLAAAHTVNIIIMTRTKGSSILSMRLEKEQIGPGIILKLLEKAINLKKPKADHCQFMRPSVVVYSRAKPLHLFKVTCEARFYQEAGLMLKKYTRFDCESINKALAETIALLVNDCQKGFFDDVHLGD